MRLEQYKTLINNPAVNIREFRKLLLEEKDIKVVMNRWHLLHRAIQSGQIEYIKILLNKGAEIDQSNSSDEIPLHLAVTTGNEAIVELLLKEHADPTLKDAKNFTALDVAYSLNHRNIADMIKAKVSQRDSEEAGTNLVNYKSSSYRNR